MLMWALKRKYSSHERSAKHLFVLLPVPTLSSVCGCRLKNPTGSLQKVPAGLKTQLALFRKFHGLKMLRKTLRIQRARSNGHSLWGLQSQQTGGGWSGKSEISGFYFGNSGLGMPPCLPGIAVEDKSRENCVLPQLRASRALRCDHESLPRADGEHPSPSFSRWSAPPTSDGFKELTSLPCYFGAWHPNQALPRWSMYS